MENNLKLGRPGKSEGERRFAKAWELEQDGDLVEALAAYQTVIAEVEPKGDDALYLKLAQQQIDKLKPAVALAASAQQAASDSSAAESTSTPDGSDSQPPAAPAAATPTAANSPENGEL
jgi:hypothetical protein